MTEQEQSGQTPPPEQENPPEATPTVEPEEAENLTQENQEGLGDQNESEVTLALREAFLSKAEQDTDMEGLAGAMDSFIDKGGFSPGELDSLVRDVLEEKSAVLGIDKAQAETLAGEIISIEEALITPLKSELPDTKAISSVRESLYQLALKNIISGEKVCSLVTSIKFRENPGEEVGEHAQALHGMSCVYLVNGNSREIYIYGPFIKESKTAQRTIISHEIGHLLAESTNLFDFEQYAKFKEFAQNPTDENIALMQAENPQFAYLLQVIKEPTAHLPMWNQYIRGRLKKLETISQPDQLAKERVAVAKELVAEMIGSYLCAGESNEAYFIDQIKYSKPEDVIAYIKGLCGCDQDDQFVAFCRQNGVDLAALRDGSSSEIIRKLSEIPQLQIVFKSSASWREMLANSLSDRGTRLETNGKTDAIGEDYDDDGFIGTDGESLAQSYTMAQRAGGTQAGEKSENAFEKVWDFLTGNAARTPGATKKAA